MRTTLTIDDDVLRAARQLAHAGQRSLGATISDLAREALSRAQAPSAVRNGVSLLPVRSGAVGAAMDEVNELRDDIA